MTLHIYTAEKKRTRRYCPYHKRLCYGFKQEYYDTLRIFFDCGTMVDTGYGSYDPPKLYKRIVLFKDETGYSVMARYSFDMLARCVPLERARRIAKQRLAKDGILHDESKGEVRC